MKVSHNRSLERTSTDEQLEHPTQLLGALDEMTRLLCQVVTSKVTDSQNVSTYVKIGLLLFTITIRYLRRRPQK